MQSIPGTYVLVLKSRFNMKVAVGRRGTLKIEPGYYHYVGSAMGPGGIRARVSRHWKKSKPKHWHIDYLSERLEPVGAWYRYGAENLEHRWARALLQMEGMKPVQGFGCSDCKCCSHLFVATCIPDQGGFSKKAGMEFHFWSYPEDNIVSR